MPICGEYNSAGGDYCNWMHHVQEKNVVQKIWNKKEGRKPQREKTERNAGYDV